MFATLSQTTQFHATFESNRSKMMAFIPLPNQPGTGPARINNYVWTQNAFIDSDQWSVRVDHRFSERHNLFGRLTRNTGDSGNSGPFGTVADNVLGIDQTGS